MNPLQLELIGHFSTPNKSTKIELDIVGEFIHPCVGNVIQNKHELLSELKSLIYYKDDLVEEVVDVLDINENELSDDSKANNRDDDEVLYTPDSYEYYDYNNIALSEQPNSEEFEMIEEYNMYDDVISDLTESSENVHNYKCLSFGNIFNFKWY